MTLRNRLSEHITDTGVLKRFSDDELLRAYSLNGNRRAVFMEIVSRFKEKVYYHVRRILVNHDDADDAAQNTFIRVWENLDSFRGDCALYSWIYRIATNEALSILRKKKNNIPIEDAELTVKALKESGPVVSGDEIMLRLQRATMLLPEKQRLVFYLKYFEDMTYEQISEVTGTSVGALKASYFHAVAKIEKTIHSQI